MTLRAWSARALLPRLFPVRLLILLSLAAPAHAIPPGITGAPIRLDFQTNPGAIINLRQQGVVIGTAPLQVTIGQALVNGSISQQVIGTSDYPGEGSRSVCVEIQSSGFDPAIHTSVEIPITVTGGNQQSQTLTVRLVQQAGPTVNPQNNADVDACFDNNQAPVANAGPVARTVADTDGKPGENVTLDGSASTDADGSITNYQWTLPDSEQTLGNGPSPTLVAALPDGVNRVQLTVTDDSGDSETGISTTEVNITVGVAVPTTLTANAGPDQSVKDTDAQLGENVTLNGSASATNNPQFPIATYVWTSGETELGDRKSVV